jgi:hypothetical protein
MKKFLLGLYAAICFVVALYENCCETWSLTLREEHRLRVFENRETIWTLEG